MQRLLGLAAATALILSATLAHADQITGYVRNINTTKNTFAVGDTVFTAAPNNTVGTPVTDLNEGDKVTVMYQKSTSGAVNNASSISVIEPAPVAAVPKEMLAEHVLQGCKTELQTYCSQVTPGQNRLLACLYANGDKLSAQCDRALYESASALDRAISNMSYVADQCRTDIDSKCANIQPGKGRIAQCLADHKASLSQACTQAIKAVRAQME
jgi:cysteine rich repeat protein